MTWRTCEHETAKNSNGGRNQGVITCTRCGAEWTLTLDGPAWLEPIDLFEARRRSALVHTAVLDGMSNKDFRAQYLQQPFPAPTAADCRKGSCQRHGMCMYLNYLRCPLNDGRSSRRTDDARL